MICWVKLGLKIDQKESTTSPIFSLQYFQQKAKIQKKTSSVNFLHSPNFDFMEYLESTNEAILRKYVIYVHTCGEADKQTRLDFQQTGISDQEGRPWQIAYVRKWRTQNQQVLSQTHFFSFLSTWSNFKKLGLRVLWNNSYIRFLIPTMWHVFHDVVFILRF